MENPKPTRVIKLHIQPLKKWQTKANIMLGANFNGSSSWDGVEAHLRIFGHLPTEEGGAFTCEKEQDGGRQKVEEFFDKLL